MKWLLLPLLLSLGLNTWLVAVWRTPSPPIVADAPTVLPSAGPAPTSSAAPPAAPPTWTALAGNLSDSPADDAALVARLRAAGFSPDMLRAVLRHRLAARDAAREADLIASQPPVAFWTAAGRGPDRTPEVSAQLRTWAFAREKQLEALLGPDAESPAERAARERRFGPLPRLKALELENILSDYRDLENAERRARQDLLFDNRAETLAALNAERDRDIAALLSPAELTEYNRRADDTARRLQSTVAEFKPTQAEYEAIHSLQSAFDAQWGSSTVGLSREQRTARTEAQRALDAEIEAALGAERYADYRTLTDREYLALKQFTDRLELPPENALAVKQLQTETSTAVRNLMRDRNLSPEARTAQAEALQNQATTQLQSLLTADGATAYRESLYGRWLRPAPTLPAAPAPRPNP